MALRWARLGTAKPPPRFPSRLGNTSTQNMDNECFQPPLQAKMSYPGDPALGTNWKTLVEEFDEKIPLQGSKHYMSLENSSLCMGRDLRSCPGAPAVARGMNIWSSQLCEMVWKKFRKVTFFFSCLARKERDALTCTLLSRKVHSGCSLHKAALSKICTFVSSEHLGDSQQSLISSYLAQVYICQALLTEQ